MMMQWLRSRIYLLRILLSFMLVVLMLVGSSILFYYNSQSKVLAMQADSDRKLLTQINYNIENMNNIIQTLAMSVYYDNDLVALKSGSDFLQSLTKLEKLNQLVTFSPFLHSIVIYNGKQDRFFSSTNHNLDNEQMIKQVGQMLNEGKALPKLQLFPVRYGSKQEEQLLTFVMYDGASANGLLLLNIKPEWLLNNLNTLNRLAERQNNAILLINQEGNLLIRNQQLPDQETIKTELLQHIADSERSLDYFTYTHAGKTYMTTYLSGGVNDWKMISLQAYEEVLNNVRELRLTASLLTIAVTIVTVLLVWYSSHRLYRPINNLVKQVNRDHRHPSSATGDELSFLSNIYAQLNERVKDAETGQVSQQYMAKSDRLRSLIADSQALKQDEFSAMIEQYQLDLKRDGFYAAAVVKIDNGHQIAALKEGAAISLFYSAIANIAEELLRADFACQAVDMRSDHIVLLISCGEPLDFGELQASFQQIQGIVQSYYKITFTATLSERFDRYTEITQFYEQAQRYSNYRIVFGKQSVIMPEIVEENERNESFTIPPELEKRITESIKSGDLAQTDEALKKWMQHVSRFTFENMFSALLHLVVILNHTLSEINHYSLNPIAINLHSISRRIFEKETLEEIRTVLMDVIRELSEKRQHKKEDRNRLIVEAIKEIIDAQFHDPDLNVQKIADLLKMRHVYLGQLFKEYESMTIVDSINDRRLERAKLYLEQHDWNVNEIMVRVGFGNESYFYRLFKRKYGTTPKEYRIKKGIELKN